MIETFAIVQTADLANYDFEQLRQDNAVTCRKSVDASISVISWIGEMPEFVNPISTHTKEEIAEVLNGSDWVFEIE